MLTSSDKAFWDTLSDKPLHTRFGVVDVPISSFRAGFPLGRGKCKAVLFKPALYALNTTTGNTLPTSAQRWIYIGDGNSQDFEVLEVGGGEAEAIVLCQDLSEVYVRNATGIVQVRVPYIIYGTSEDFA